MDMLSIYKVPNPMQLSWFPTGIMESDYIFLRKKCSVRTPPDFGEIINEYELCCV